MHYVDDVIKCPTFGHAFAWTEYKMSCDLRSGLAKPDKKLYGFGLLYGKMQGQQYWRFYSENLPYDMAQICFVLLPSNLLPDNCFLSFNLIPLLGFAIRKINFYKSIPLSLWDVHSLQQHEPGRGHNWNWRENFCLYLKRQKKF